jgi:hypothetical protein
MKMSRAEFPLHMHALLYEIEKAHENNVVATAISILERTYHPSLVGESYDEGHALVTALVKMHKCFFIETYQCKNTFYQLPLSLLMVISHIEEAWIWYERRVKPQRSRKDD